MPPTCRQAGCFPLGGEGGRDLKDINFDNKFYFKYKLLTRLVLLKLDNAVFFHWQVTLQTRIILLSDKKKKSLSAGWKAKVDSLR